MKQSIRIPYGMRISLSSRTYHHANHYLSIGRANKVDYPSLSPVFYYRRNLPTMTSSSSSFSISSSPEFRSLSFAGVSPLTAVAEGLITQKVSFLAPQISSPLVSNPSFIRSYGTSTMDSGGSSSSLSSSQPPMPVMQNSLKSSSTQTKALSPVSSTVWFDLHEGLRLALQEMGIKYPSDIQQIAIPSLLQGNDGLVTAATGTGKTLTYLLPIIHRLKVDEDMRNIITRPQRPRVLIITPTRELTLQVGQIAKQLSHTTKFSSYILVGGRKDGWQKESLQRNMDILITTVGKLQQALEKGWVSLRDVRYLCMDEADTLLNEKEGFMDDLQSILKPILYTEKQQSLTVELLQDISNATKESIEGNIYNELQRVQVVLIGATMPHPIEKVAKKLFPSLIPINAHSTHRLPSKLEQRFIRIGGEPDAKHNSLMETLSKVIAPTYVSNESLSISSTFSGTKNKGIIVHSTPSPKSSSVPLPRILIFCNTLNSARSTAYYLGEQGYSITCLHGGIPPKLRQKEYELFTSGKHRIMVCTDAAARGLDFPGLTMVINFDFPLHPIEYIHRAGRVARAGRSGICVNLVLRKDLVLATSIERATDKGEDISILSSNKVDYVPSSQKAIYTSTKEKRVLKHKQGISQQTRRRLVIRNRIDSIKNNSAEGKEKDSPTYNTDEDKDNNYDDTSDSNRNYRKQTQRFGKV